MHTKISPFVLVDFAQLDGMTLNAAHGFIYKGEAVSPREVCWFLRGGYGAEVDDAQRDGETILAAARVRAKQIAKAQDDFRLAEARYQLDTSDGTEMVSVPRRVLLVLADILK